MEPDQYRADRTVKLYARVNDALKIILPAMQADGGGIVIERLEENAVVIGFVGACRFCPSQELTIAQTIRPALEAVLPEGMQLVIIGEIVAQQISFDRRIDSA